MTQLFSPLTLKGITLRNRIAVSPMCQYSAVDGHPNDWHFVHLGARALGGAGLVVMEATAVTPEGRISAADTGLWSEDHIEGFSRISAFLKAHGAVAGIQLAHAGRKASTHKPWEGGHSLSRDEGAWLTLAPSAIPFGDRITHLPKAMDEADLARVRTAYVEAAKRALEAGFEWLELHFAHGYLAHSFYSPLSNHREDAYGGSFAGRTRLLREIFRDVRAVWPETFPLGARLSVTDWIDGGITVDESVELTKLLQADGLDFLDVSHGFVVPGAGMVPWGPGFMLDIAARIRRESEVPVSVGWMLGDPERAQAAIAEGKTDLVMLARPMLDDPHWPYHAAQKLGTHAPGKVLPLQYARA